MQLRIEVPLQITIDIQNKKILKDCHKTFASEDKRSIDIQNKKIPIQELASAIKGLEAFGKNSR